jgi:DNA-binding response OmpR family regulator
MPIKSRVLFVEDHEDTRQLVALWLGMAGYEVETADGVAGALELARDKSFDLYLLDSRFADGTGKELCERLREFDEVTPIVFYSGETPEQLRKALECHAQNFVMKPELDALPLVIASTIEAAKA